MVKTSNTDLKAEVGKTSDVAQRIAEQIVALLPPAKRKRLNLVLSEHHIERMERLARLTDASSVAEVVREAMFVYECLVEKLLQGSSFKELTSKNELFPMELGIDVRRATIGIASPPIKRGNAKQKVAAS